jgi:hypothetical protein
VLPEPRVVRRLEARGDRVERMPVPPREREVRFRAEGEARRRRRDDNIHRHQGENAPAAGGWAVDPPYDRLTHCPEELVGGEVYEMIPAPLPRRQEVLFNLGIELRRFVVGRK